MEIATAALPFERDDAGRETGRTGVNLRLSFEACYDGLYRFILIRVGGDRHTADELLQQVCCVAIDHRRPPDDPAACEAWFRGIAVNLIRKHWRTVRRSNGHLRIGDGNRGELLAEDMESRPLPPDVLASKEISDHLLKAITALPATEQRLIFAFYFEGRSHNEIASSLAVTSKSIENRLYRARRQLRAILSQKKRD